MCSWRTVVTDLLLRDASLFLVVALPMSLSIEKERLLMVTTRQAWIGIVLLLLVVLLAVIFAVYWQHVTGLNTVHVLLADGPGGPIGQGC